jgi:hypothetical protein
MSRGSNPSSPTGRQNRKASITHGAIDLFSAQSLQNAIGSPDMASHPFGQELAQVRELAEEFGGRNEISTTVHVPVIDPEEQELLDAGLKKWSAMDYISEIQGLYEELIVGSSPSPQPNANMWI